MEYCSEAENYRHIGKNESSFLWKEIYSFNMLKLFLDVEMRAWLTTFHCFHSVCWSPLIPPDTSCWWRQWQPVPRTVVISVCCSHFWKHRCSISSIHNLRQHISILGISAYYNWRSTANKRALDGNTSFRWLKNFQSTRKGLFSLTLYSYYILSLKHFYYINEQEKSELLVHR